MTILAALRTLLRPPYRAMPYRDYLATPNWQRKRQAALRRAEHRCQVCGSVERLEVHHNTYERLGHERAADLFVVCHECHRKIHGKGKGEK